MINPLFYFVVAILHIVVAFSNINTLSLINMFAAGFLCHMGIVSLSY